MGQILCVVVAQQRILEGEACNLGLPPFSLIYRPYAPVYRMFTLRGHKAPQSAV